MLFPNAGVEVNPALLLLLGLMVGTLSGFFGVGGGFLITSGLLVLGVPPLFAVGTGLTLIMGSSLINTLKHRQVGNVDFKLGSLMILGTIPGVLLAERVNSQLEDWGVAGPVISYTYVALLATVGSFILYDYMKIRNSNVSDGERVSTYELAQKVQHLRIPPHSIGFPGRMSLSTYVHLPISEIQQLSLWVPIGIGFGVGFIAGLLGAGGGFILMPILVFLIGVPTIVAVGTGLFQVVITGSVGTLVYALSNNVDLLMAVIMLAAASIGSQLGVLATNFIEGARIRSLYGIAILSAGVSVALQQVSESAGPEYLSTIAAVVLLGVAGVICLIIAGMIVTKRRSHQPH